MNAKKILIILIYITLPILLAYMDASYVTWVGAYLLLYFIHKYINKKLMVEN